MMSQPPDASGSAPPAPVSEPTPAPASAAAFGSASSPISNGATRSGRWGSPRLWGALVLLVIALAAVAWMQQRSGRTERELARRAQASEARVTLAEQQLRSLTDALREVQGKSAVIEARLAESLGQQAQMRLLYEQVAQARGEAVLAEVESAVTMAAHQLQLTGNIPSALIALQEADRSLSKSNQPEALGLRRVLARDIERLKALPVADFATAVNRLDALIALIDQLPLRADVLPSEPTSTAGPQEPVAAGLRGLPERMVRTGTQGWQTFVAELRQLVTVQRIDTPEAFLLSPSQRTFARENLRLMLLNARLNLLARNESLFRSDVGKALAQVERYFDPNSRPVSASINTLRQFESGALSLQLPSLNETLSAIRTARPAGESR
ncbi:MAG: putative uroporphyrinogen-III C-methyltransferase [Pseudomonadota bacterium]